MTESCRSPASNDEHDTLVGRDARAAFHEDVRLMFGARAANVIAGFYSGRYSSPADVRTHLRSLGILAAKLELMQLPNMGSRTTDLVLRWAFSGSWRRDAKITEDGIISSKLLERLERAEVGLTASLAKLAHYESRVREARERVALAREAVTKARAAIEEATR